jgi:hypothetical protein
MDVFFSAPDRQEYLDLLSQSVSKHELEFPGRCPMSNHAHCICIRAAFKSFDCLNNCRVYNRYASVGQTREWQKNQKESKVFSQ